MFNSFSQARKAAKMTQEQLAAELKVNRATISKYESGAIDPPIGQIIQMSKIFNISIVDLLGMEPEGGAEEKKLLERLLQDYLRKHGNIDSSILEKIYYFDERGLRFRGEGDLFELFVAAFDALNEEGQSVAVSRVQELTEIPKYQK